MISQFLTASCTAAALLATTVASASGGDAQTAPVSDEIVAAQRASLQANTEGQGFGPQAPRDITVIEGANERFFEAAPPASEMALCDIHFHEGAEHRGGEYTTYAGNGDGKGYGTGFVYDGELTEAELAPYAEPVGATDHGDLVPGDTIEVHYVHSTAKATLGPTLGTCLSEAIMNPQLRVEAQVMVLVNDEAAADFRELAAIEEVNGLNQAVGIPTDTGTPIVYAGSTTGPSYNENGSPFQVTWSVRPGVKKVNIATVAAWFADNPFGEDHAHGVRNLVLNEALLAPIN